MTPLVLNFPRLTTAPTVLDGLVYSGESARGGHQVALLTKCMRAWGLKHVAKVPRIESPSLDDKVPAWALGTIVHQGLAQMVGERCVIGGGLLDAHDGVRKRAAQEGYPQAAEQALALAIKFYDVVLTEQPHWVPMAAEPSIEVDFGPDAGVFTSGADAVFWDSKTREPIVVDWKTAGRVASAQSYPYSPQYLRYRMILRLLARANGQPDDWGKVIVGVIPTGKTNFGKRELVECPYFAEATDTIETQTHRELVALTAAEAMPLADVMARPTIGACTGQYSPCAYRDTHCFIPRSQN